MDEKFRLILTGVRELSLDIGIRNLSLESICQHLHISKDDLKVYVSNEAELVEKVLEFERESFKSIFDEHNFEDVNAIDILLIVSQEMNNRFRDLTPSITLDLKMLYPEIYQHHFEQRIEFIFGKIKINIEKGIRQGIYRQDLSIELLARLYISRLIDLHNPVFFPPDKFSFPVLFEVMFENFIRGIANDEGLEYFKKRRKSFRFSV
ncbi:MAG: TetR/AcrR family transcriptional regulator [Bacteroidales bacterium]|nr:TetR/AcrR family transcriptional regulator [Bacteroidales bacterium]